jgi:hypothetical protein
MIKLEPQITVLFLNLLATGIAMLNPAMATRLPDIYLASIGGSWALYQMNTKGDDRDGNY